MKTNRFYRPPHPAVLKQMRTRAWYAQDGHCYFCKEKVPLEVVTADHLEPRYAGGQTLPGNIVAACAPCNNSRNGAETDHRPKGHSYPVAGDPTPRSPFEVLKRTDDDPDVQV